MTSKSLFVKLQKEDIKRRVWTLILTILVFLFVLPIRCALNMGNYSDVYKQQQYRINDFIGTSSTYLPIITILCSILCGLGGFFYLQSRKKVDFYHSIPVRREIMFTVSYLNGFLIFLIPYVINVILCFAIFNLNHVMSTEVFSSALEALGINTLYFCLVYTITIIAVLLTGNIIVSAMGTAVFLLYAPILSAIKDAYFTSFFQTYYRNDGAIDNLLFLSPVGSYIKVFTKYGRGENVTSYIIIAIIVTAVLIGIAILLYKKRPSEAAQNAMAFEISKPIVKFLLVIPISLGGGIVFFNIATNHNMGWFAFGIILALIISYALIQIIYNFDIRFAFHHKKQFLACAVISSAIACVFRFDLFHFNTYIPEVNEIKSMSVFVQGIDRNFQYLKTTDGDNYSFKYTSPASYHLNHMKLTNFDSAYALAKQGMESPCNRSGWDKNVYQYDDFYTYIVKYTLENGRIVYRQYRMEINNSTEFLKDIYENSAYKIAHYPLFQWNENDIDEILVNYASEILNYNPESQFTERIAFYSNFNSGETKQLINTYKAELMHLTWEETAHSAPVAELEFKVNDIISGNYYVYPSFTKTIMMLNNYGFDTSKTIDSKAITGIIVSNNINSMAYDNASIMKTEELSQAVNYSKEKDINEIMPSLIDSEFYENNKNIIQVEEGISASVRFKINDSGIEQDFYYNFMPDKVPEFIKEDVKYDSK